MTPATPRGLEIAGQQLIALALVQAFLPHVASGQPWTGTLSQPGADQVLQKARAQLRTSEHHQVGVITALARQCAAGLALALHDTTPAALYGWLDQRTAALDDHGQPTSELTAALIVRAVVPELTAGTEIDDVPPGITQALARADDDPYEVLVSLALFAATMFLHAFQSVEVAVAAINAQAAPLRPSPN
ncbi:MAG: hypothetical protein JWN00_6219 [Actinomycetia bacterium]|nr:hypothetical protein [Actinomycetes bacterium]